MGTGFHVLALGVQDSTSVPATSKMSANQRVKTSAGAISVATDVLSFPGPSTVGNWIVPNQRVLIGNIPSIGQSSSGQAIRPIPPPTPGPLVVMTTDTRASGS